MIGRKYREVTFLVKMNGRVHLSMLTPFMDLSVSMRVRY
jgi:hypothetical protein